MHNTVDYSKRLTPNFDAVNDVKSWFGDRWDQISPEMAKITNPNQFALAASFGGIQGFPVKAWYELYHGEGSWDHNQPKG